MYNNVVNHVFNEYFFKPKEQNKINKMRCDIRQRYTDIGASECPYMSWVKNRVS